MIDKEIENFLKRKDTDEQLKYLKSELKADLSSHFKKLNEFQSKNDGFFSIFNENQL